MIDAILNKQKVKCCHNYLTLCRGFSGFICTQKFKGRLTLRIKNPFKTRIGLALGGGGARGIAHIGVLKAMSESEHKIDCIAGTSAGALIATLYAFGMDWQEIKDIFSSLSLTKLGAFSLGSPGLMNGNRVADLIKKHIGNVDIADASIPLAIVCCDLISGKNVIFTQGPAALLVQASGAFPGLFNPVPYDGMLLVDGFLTENVPVSAVRKLGANFVVAVNLGTKGYSPPAKLGISDVINRSFDILVNNPLDRSARRIAYSIELDMSFMDRFKVTEVAKPIDLGYRQTKLMLSKSLLYWYFQPILIYYNGISHSFNRLMRSLLRKPNLRLPGFQKLFKSTKPVKDNTQMKESF